LQIHVVMAGLYAQAGPARGPVDLAQMMKIGLISLGVPAGSVKAAARGEYRIVE
jgi:hypothetical protein